MKTYRDFVSSLLHEKSLSPSDIDSLINRAKDSVRNIIQNKNRDPSERKQGREVLRWIQGVQRTPLVSGAYASAKTQTRSRSGENAFHEKWEKGTELFWN